MMFSEDLLKKCISSEQDINKAKRYGRRFVVKNDEGKITAYIWKREIYISAIELFGEQS